MDEGLAPRPRVTVVVPSLNGATRGFVTDAIESVRSQTFRDFELFLVDDGSTDGTRALFERFTRDPRVRVISQQNRGLAGARNTGIRAGSAEYIALLDDDDVWQPTKLERQVAILDDPANADVSLVYTALELIDESGRRIGEQFHGAEGDIYRRLFYDNVVDAPSSVLIRRATIDAVGAFSEDLWICEDIDLFLRIARVARVRALPERLVRYRVHQQKMSHQHRRLEDHQILVLRRHLAHAPASIVAEADGIWHHLYAQMALKHFSLGNMDEFRRYYALAAEHRQPVPQLRLRHMLSGAPRVTRAMQAIWRAVAHA